MILMPFIFFNSNRLRPSKYHAPTCSGFNFKTSFIDRAVIHGYYRNHNVKDPIEQIFSSVGYFATILT